MHVAMQALHRFRQQHGRLPDSWNDADADAVVTHARDVNEGMRDKVRRAEPNSVLQCVTIELAHDIGGLLSEPLFVLVGPEHITHEIHEACVVADSRR